MLKFFFKSHSTCPTFIAMVKWLRVMVNAAHKFTFLTSDREEWEFTVYTRLLN